MHYKTEQENFWSGEFGDDYTRRNRGAALEAANLALFARLLLQDAPLMLLDEPFTAIDEATAKDLMAMVLRWHGEGRTVVAVLHDMDLVRAHFPRTLVLAREQVAWGPTAKILASPDPMAAARKMMEAWDEHAAICGRRAA